MALSLTNHKNPKIKGIKQKTKTAANIPETLQKSLPIRTYGPKETNVLPNQF